MTANFSFHQLIKPTNVLTSGAEDLRDCRMTRLTHEGLEPRKLIDVINFDGSLCGLKVNDCLAAVPTTSLTDKGEAHS